MSGIVGLGKACETVIASLVEESARLESLCSHLFNRIASQINGCVLNGCEQVRLPGRLSVGFSGFNGTELISDLREVALSPGTTCSSATPVSSHVLSAMGLGDAEA